MLTIRSPQSPLSSLRGPSVRERFQELNAASSRDAAALAAQGKQASLWRLIGAPPLVFLQSYLWRGGWRHGVEGFVSALFAAYEVFVRYAKLWEHYHKEMTPPPPPQR
jgi:hypothetical protein